MKEGQKGRQKGRLILQAQSHAPFCPLSNCTLFVACTWLFPSHSCHTQKTHTRLPSSSFFPSSLKPHLLVFLSYFSTATHQSSLHYSFAALHQISLLLFSEQFPRPCCFCCCCCWCCFFCGVFFSQKCCFFVNLQLLPFFFFFLTCS